MDFSLIQKQAKEAFDILMETAKPKAGQLLVLGCSTSEIMGKRIGSCSTVEAAQAVYSAIAPKAMQHGLFLAVQGCEHINRSLCVCSEAMEKFDLQQVWVKPHLHAGGACITQAYESMENAVMVEDLKGRATLGIDIGDTLIGMHLHPVAVPIHSELRRIGEANLVLAYSRPKYVGGPRAEYENGRNPHK
ncbi:MAG: TIGR01440 family protein [Clostridia bacterium]|nr:TIGR01440 family protein [Clostridia bacterium]